MRKRKAKRTNGKSKKARQRVLDYALLHGSISNEKAKKVGGWAQSWYHLNKLCELGLLKRKGYSDWRPTRSSMSL